MDVLHRCAVNHIQQQVVQMHAPCSTRRAHNLLGELQYLGRSAAFLSAYRTAPLTTPPATTTVLLWSQLSVSTASNLHTETLFIQRPWQPPAPCLPFDSVLKSLLDVRHLTHNLTHVHANLVLCMQCIT